MATQEIVWTALPNGVRDGRLHLSVFVSPRLVGDAAKGTLAPFTDWHDWPAKDITFAVSVGGAPGVPATAVGPAPRSDLWKRLFKADTPLASYADPTASLPDKKIRSLPVLAIRDFVRNEYTRLAAYYPDERPTYRNYISDGGGGGLTVNGEIPPDFIPRVQLGDIHLDPERKRAAVQAIKTQLAQGYFDGYPDEGGEEGFQAKFAGCNVNQIAFLLTEQFQNRQASNNPQPQPPPPPPPPPRLAADEPPELDFHTVIGSLTEYPALLRMLGLVRDISIPLPSPLPGSPTTVRVTPSWTRDEAITKPDVTPITACVLTSTAFYPAAGQDSLIDGGMLKVDTDAFDLVEIDPDASASKILALADTIDRDPRNPQRDADAPQAPPSLESRGLSLQHKRRARALHASLQRAVGLQASAKQQKLAEEHLDADDLSRGYRIDIWDDVSNAWHSLCLRDGRYTLGGTTVDVADEGTIVPAHTEQLDDPATIYLHESLARWMGYSLVAPRPGLGTADDGSLAPGDSEPGDAFDLKATFKARKGTLPKLRFGRTYRLRARVSDLAGNGPRLQDVPGNDPHTTDPVTYRRFEPVEPPHVLNRKPRTEGESAERLVVRSNYNTPPAADSQRHLAPQRTAELIAEQHGMFDVPKSILNPGGISHNAYGLIAAKDPGSFADGGTPDPGSQDVPYYDTDQLQLPYLPDPIARGVAFKGLPGMGSDEVFTVDFDYAPLKKWPDARPFRIRLVEGSGAPEFNSLKRVLTVQVPRGRVATVQYSSRINAADRELLGPWGWLLEWVDNGNPLRHDLTLAQLQELAVKGQLWQLTPPRTLTLVNATRQPLLPPALSKPIAVRKIGETFAKIVDKVTLDAASTSRLDLLASWTERLDPLGEPGPVSLPGNALAYEVPVSSLDQISIGDVHEFQDTKHRKVSYSLVATSRYAEYFVERKLVTLPKGEAVQVSAAGIVPGSDVVTTLTPGKAVHARDTDYTVDYAQGKVTAKAALEGKQVEVTFVAPPITRSSTEAKPASVVDVPSSARPAAPDVAYVIPTFGWEQSSTNTGISSTRRGNGLRVYLRRGWYSSGDGEQLGVVVMGADGAVPGRLEPYVTRWGQDPVFASTGATPAPRTADFPLAVHPKNNLKLAESERDSAFTERVSVAPHNVAYDADRRLWYADLTLRPGDTYNPFIRLALARYQPISITGVELSTVVLAQFAQLAADRSLSIVFDGADTRKLQVTLTGKTYTPVLEPSKGATAKVLVQQATAGLTGDLAWETAAETTLTASNPVGSWSGTVTLPAARSSRPFRLVVQEFEQPTKGGTRLVYADTVKI